MCRSRRAHHLYIVEPEQESPTGAYIKDNFDDISSELGTSAAIVVGHVPDVSNQIMTFLNDYLTPGMQMEVQRMMSGKICALATNKPLPNTDAMVVLPICNVDDPADLGSNRIRKIIDAIKSDSFRKIVDADDSLKIQQGHFDLPTTDAGIMFLRKANQFFPTKIPLFFVDIELNKIFENFLARYPQIGG